MVDQSRSISGMA